MNSNPTAEALPGEFAAELRRTAAARGRWGSPAYFFSEIGSTNDEAARLADLGAAEGTTVLASAQTAGRGRFGRTWFSPPGAGLYVSAICRDRRAAPFVSLAGGVAVAEGVRAATGLPVEIKWPNDIVVDAGLGRRRKLAGILAEASTTSDGLQYIVLGFGINLRSAAYPPDIADRATSLEAELGREVDPGALLAAILVALNERMTELQPKSEQRTANSGPLLARWRALAPSAVGALVEWDGPSGVRSGRTAGVDDDGALRVNAEGGVERIISGTLRWI